MKSMLLMRSAAVTLLLTAGVALAKEQPANLDVAQPLRIGAAVPLKNVKMKSVDGKDVTLAGVAGKNGTLVVFTCNHCPWAKMWQTRVAAIGNAALEQGVGVVAVNSNDPAAYPEDDYANMKTRAKELGFKFPYAVDATSDVARAFGASRTPEAFVFDAKGKLVYHGTIDDNARDESAVTNPWLRQAVNAVAEGKEVATSETKSMGCGIKYREKKST